MSTIEQVSNSLKGMESKFRSASQGVLNKEAKTLLFDLRERSPEDTGEYKTKWAITPTISGTISANVLASTGIANTDEKATIMEFGATPKQAPWFYPGKRKKTGKLIVRQGRVWAGGLNPGHHLTVGSAIDKTMFKNNRRQLALAKKVAEAVMEAIR